jgi:hypothetical protein
VQSSVEPRDVSQTVETNFWVVRNFSRADQKWKKGSLGLCGRGAAKNPWPLRLTKKQFDSARIFSSPPWPAIEMPSQ